MKAMKQRLTFGLFAAVASVLLLQPSPASAVPISISMDLDQVYAGYTPDGSPPWLTAEFDQSPTDPSMGTLTLTSRLDGNFVQGLNSGASVMGWAFYLDQSLASISCSSGSCASNGPLFGGSYNTGPVPGTFNLAFGWDASSRFDDSKTAVYLLTFDNALSGTPFVANASGWLSVAHVQGIGPAGSCSGYIVSGNGALGNGGGLCGDPNDVPEPGSLGMLGLGVLLVGVFLGLRRRRHA